MISDYQQRLFIVYNRAIAKARKSDDAAKIIQRLHKSFSILQSIDYYRDERAQYQPTISSCNCDDWKYHNAAKRKYVGHCKHMMAEVLLDRMQCLQYQQINFFHLVNKEQRS